MNANDVQNSITLAVSHIAKNASQLNKQNENDYYENGLLMCGKCHTPKQCRGFLFGVERTVTCICKCRAEELQAEREREEHEKRLARVQELRKAGFPERELQSQTFSHDDGADERTMRAMKNFVEHYDDFRRMHKGLLLYGNSGSGKTFAAACVVNALIDKGVACLMTNFGRVFNTLWGTEQKQAYLDGFNQFELLVLDDLGAERRTEFAQELVFQIIDSRCRSGLPTIITTNLTIEAIKKPQTITETRIYDRILQMCHPVEVTHASRRRKKVAEGFAATNKLLGL